MRQKRPRLRTFDYLGRYRYFLTFATHYRRKLFDDRAVVDLVLAHILHAATRCEFAVPAYCLMPDHVHLFVKGQADNSDLREFVKLAKQTSGYAYSQARRDRLWQPSFYDRALRDDECDLFYIAYILRNPVASGLVANWRDYPFLGSATGPVEDLVQMLEQGLGKGWDTVDMLIPADECARQA
jgi:putative transposase